MVWLTFRWPGWAWRRSRPRYGSARELARLVVWAAFLVLSAWHARAIPFFAVVAGPVAARNFFDFAAALGAAAADAGRGRMWAFGGRILTLLVGVALVVLTWPGWLEAQPEFHASAGPWSRTAA